jgi:hypothetical protein
LAAVLVALTPHGVAEALMARWLADGCAPDQVRDRLALADRTAGGA